MAIQREKNVSAYQDILNNNNTETEYTSFGTYLCLLFHIVAFDIKALFVPWHQFVYTLFISCGRRQHSSGLHNFRSVYQLLHFWKPEKVRQCQVRTVRRILVDVPMELLTQQGLCLPGSMRMYIVVQQNNSTRDLASSAR